MKRIKKGNTDENIKKYRIKRDKAKAIITKTKTSSWTNFINYININTNPKQAGNQIDNIKGIKKTNNIPLENKRINNKQCRQSRSVGTTIPIHI